MPISCVGTAFGYNYGTTLTCNKPTGTADGDLMVWVGFWGSTTAVTNPSGWTFFASETIAGTYVIRAYRKVASSEGASYSWSSAGTTGRSVTIATYRGGYDTANIVKAFSDVGYTASDAIIRAGGVTTTAVNSPLLMLCSARADTGAMTTTKPSALDDNWIEDSDNSVAYHGGQAIYHCTWSGSGATGDVDATYAQTPLGFKHAFLIALNPSTDGAVYVPKLLRY